MKRNSFTLLIMAVIFSTVLISCSEDNPLDPTNTIKSKLSFVVNGGGYTNQTFTYEKLGTSTYTSSQNATLCSFIDNSDNPAALTFSGNSTGTQQVDVNNSFTASFDNTNIVFLLISGTITVSKYGNIAGEVSGTFSGTGTVTKNTTTVDTVTINNGTFKARRVM